MPYVRTVPTRTTDTEMSYETLDGDAKLKELGLEDGDTLRLRRV